MRVLDVDDRQPVEPEHDVRVVPRAAFVRPAVPRAAQRRRRRDPRAGPRPRRRSTVRVARTRLPSMPSGSDTTARRTREANGGRARLLSRQAVEGAPRPATTARDGVGGAKAVGRVEGARAVGRAQRGGHRSGFGRVGEARGAGRAGGARVPFTAGCSVDEVLRFGWPIGVTPQATHMREFWTWSCIAALVVGVITWGAMFWAMIFHRKRAGDSDVPPRQTQYNLPIEIIFTVVPTVIVAVLFAFTVQVQNNVDGEDPSPDLKVDIIAFQWNWQFTYPDTRTPTGAPVTTIGTADTIPLLVLPTNQSHPVHPAQQRRDPQLLGAGVPVQARRLPDAGEERPGQRLADRPDRPRGRLRRPVRGAVRRLPLGDELRGARAEPGPVRPVPAAAPADQPGDGRPLHRG